MKQRIVGFDLARAYAILGMFIVNFNFSFGSLWDKSITGRCLNLFTGNSTAIFIICAGMGVSLLSNSAKDKNAIRRIVVRRSWYLFALGLLLYNWWPGDILHFYGGYMHIAALMLFLPKRYILWSAAIAIIVYHALLFIVPVGTGWNFYNYKYEDFWTIKGFFRNTFYNGWNSIFPWIAYFLLGMSLGRLDWNSDKVRKRVFAAGTICFIVFEGVRWYALQVQPGQGILNYIMSDYFPPYLPFMMITMGFAIMVITVCIYIGDQFKYSAFINALARTGAMTLTHYVLHLTLGMLLFQWLTGMKYTGLLRTGNYVSPEYILLFSLSFFSVAVVFSGLWSKRFRKGPLEMMMRWVSGG
jgi:uncharacterized protein